MEVLSPKAYAGDFEKKQGLQAESIGAILLIESARALQNIHQIASAAGEQNREFLVALGAADYALDLGIEMTKEGAELTYPRSRIPVACRAAGLAPPLDTPFMIDLKDIDALKADAKKAKQLGFQGKLCIHPTQIEPCNTIFSPTRDDILYAERVIQAFEEAEEKGLAAIQLEGGFIDYPVVERARRILKLAGTITRK
jgi:citrate lyase subunit beta/citryl-CoA lyase